MTDNNLNQGTAWQQGTDLKQEVANSAVAEDTKNTFENMTDEDISRYEPVASQVMQQQESVQMQGMTQEQPIVPPAQQQVNAEVYQAPVQQQVSTQVQTQPVGQPVVEQQFQQEGQFVQEQAKEQVPVQEQVALPVQNEETEIPKKKGLFAKINALFAPKNVVESESDWLEPKECTQNDLGYELLREDGIMRIEEGLYACCIMFSDVNYQGALRDTQLEIHSSMNDLYNSLPENCALQLVMHTRRMQSDELADILHIPLEPVDDGYNDLREEQNTIVDMKMSATAQNVKRTHCFVLSCAEVNMDRAKITLNRALGGIEQKLRDIESDHHVLDGQEWLTFINHITNPDDSEGIISFSDLAAMKGSTTKDLVAPPSITTHGTKGFMMGDYYYRTFYVSKYSNTVRDDFFSQLAEMPYNSVISMHINPYDHAEALDLVNAKRTDLNMQKKQYIKKNPASAYQDEEMLPGNLGEQLETARETRNDLVHREQSMFEQSIVIMLYSKELSELENACSEIQRITKSFNYRVSPLNDMQMLGLKAALPVGNSSVPISRSILTDALSNFSPFTADELLERDGIFGGINQLSKNVIAYDRTKSIAPNGFILGKPGRGKSVNAKSQIIQLLCRDPKARVLVLDPEGEYGGLCKLLPDTQLIQLTQASNAKFNPLDINDTYSDDESPLSFKADFIMSLVDMMTQGMTQEQLNILDRCVRLIYAPYFETKNAANMPTLQTLYDEIRRQPETAAQGLATNIERFVVGSMNMFNARTNVNLDARLIVFDTKELQKNLAPVALLVLLDQVWNFITSGRAHGAHTWFFVDEMQLLKDNQYAVNYLDQLFSRARKWGAVPTGITQNVERVLQVDQFRFMIANSDFLVILGQSKTDTDALGDVLKLSNEQKKAVRISGVGEGLLLANGKIIQFENKIPKMINNKPSKIYRALTTKLDDLIEMGLVKQ